MGCCVALIFVFMGISLFVAILADVFAWAGPVAIFFMILAFAMMFYTAFKGENQK